MNRFTLALFDIVKNRNTVYYLKEFEKFKSQGQDQIQAYQFEKLKKILIHAEENSPFYRKRFKECNFSAKEFKRIDQILLIPPLTRDDLQNHCQEILTISTKSKLYKGSSSGSTGLPVFYFKDNAAISAGQAAHFLGWSFSGWKMNMKGLHIWGNPSTVNNEWSKLSSKLKARVFRHHKFPAYKLTEGSLFNELFATINKNKYDFIDGYTNSIYLLADYIEQNQLHFIHNPKFVLTTAENLQDYQRAAIEKNIASVYDTYGCSEINGIAYECSQCKAYHIIDPHVYLEYGQVVDDIGSRELIITDLDNYAFPLLRYKNDDLGIPAPADSVKCGIGFSRMKSVNGRQSDIIRFKGGGALSVPSFFGSMLLKQVKGIKQYQIEKLSDELLVINLVKSMDFSEIDLEIVRNSLDDYFNDRIKYEIRFCDRIEHSKTGKFKILVDRTKGS